MKKLITLLLIAVAVKSTAQTVNGRVIDNASKEPLAFVFVTSASGSVFTDEKGLFSLKITKPADTIRITNMGYLPYALAAATWGEPPRTIQLHTDPIHLKQVTIKARRSYRDYVKDSVSIRKQYQKTFAYRPPGFYDVFHQANSDVPFAFASIDVLAVIRLIGSKNNPQNKLKKELLRDEKERHIDFRFTKGMVAGITHLTGDSLESFMINYRPSAATIDHLTDYQLSDYIKDKLQKFSAEKIKSTELRPVNLH